MSFADWIFYSRTTENVIPSNIVFLSESITPLVGSGSLRIRDLGSPTRATVALLPDSLTFDSRIESGRIRTIFLKETGIGFEDQGIFFLSQGVNPLHDEVEVYGVHYPSGSSYVRLTRFTNGLHDTAGTILGTYAVPYTGLEEPIVLEVQWEGGILSTYSGYTKIQIRFGSNTTNFGNLVDLPIFLDTSTPLFTGTSPGLFVRSRSSLEPLNSVIDMTSIYRSITV